MFPSQDPLDGADFNAVEYINTLFPTEQVSIGLPSFRWFLAHPQRDDWCVLLQIIRRLDKQVRVKFRSNPIVTDWGWGVAYTKYRCVRVEFFVL